MSAFHLNRRTFLLGLAGAAGCAGRRFRLNVLNWSTYVPPEILRQFERESGIALRYAVYESNEEMLARVMSGNSGWDVVFPTNYYIRPMREMRLLAPMNPARLKHLDNLEAPFRHPLWDPGLDWCVPYMWGATGILCNPRIAPQPGRWSDLWEDHFHDRMTMLDDPVEVFGASLKTLGRSWNGQSDPELRAAKAQALRQKPLLRAYMNSEVRDQVVSGDVAVAQVWSNTAQQAIDAASHLRFVYPAEGFGLYADNAAILRESRRGDLALRFIDFLHRADVNLNIIRGCRAATANGAAKAALGAEIQSLTTLYPTPETMARGEWMATTPLAAQRLRDRLWTELKSA
jgi:spermidine/putrescine transport system substrate-binding protein